jgi:hypothetical protein
VTIDSRTSEAIGAGYLFRNEIQKGSGTNVATGVFQSPDYEALSGLLCSRIDVVNQPTEMGADFQFVANPHARSPVPGALRLRGMYFGVAVAEDGYLITPEVR